MDAGKMMKAMGALNTFKNNHPKFLSFIADHVRTGIPVDTVIEVTITKPGCDPVTSNIKVKQSDLDLFESLKDNA